MGILNVTPDSFSDGGQFAGPAAAVEQALEMAMQGAMVIDVGGESTRPGAERVPPAEQLERVLEVVRAVRAALDEQFPAVHVSIDTTHRSVAEPAADAGATILNDVSAGREDPGLLDLAAERALPIVLMHMQGEPGTMQDRPRYKDVAAEVEAFLLERAEAARKAGLPREQIVLDPGIGFGKTLAHNLRLLAHLPELVSTGYPVLLGTSRKGFIGQLSPRTARIPKERVGGTCATTALGVQAGVQLFRVHDVAANVQAAEVAHAIREKGEATG
ncbi:MAG: dihydropteroate synthase [Phycisphaeraceae bacterium]